MQIVADPSNVCVLVVGSLYFFVFFIVLLNLACTLAFCLFA